MLPARQQRVADRIREIVAELQGLVQLGRGATNQWIPDKARLSSALVRAENIIHAAFGQDGPHAKHLAKTLEAVEGQAYDVEPVIGVLDGARDDLESGFLQRQELLIAGEVFDSLLQEARHLHDTHHSDAAAILGRVVLEDALRRMAAAAGLSDIAAAAAANDALKKAGSYGQPMWRQIQAWLDIGNAAAHGRFADYSPDQVNSMLLGIEQFLAVELK